MAHFLCHLGCSHFGALLLDFYFTENTPKRPLFIFVFRFKFIGIQIYLFTNILIQTVR